MFYTALEQSEIRKHINMRLIHILPVTFLYPLKTSENILFSDVFRGNRNVTLGEYGLSRVTILLFLMRKS